MFTFCTVLRHCYCEKQQTYRPYNIQMLHVSIYMLEETKNSQEYKSSSYTCWKAQNSHKKIMISCSCAGGHDYLTGLIELRQIAMTGMQISHPFIQINGAVLWLKWEDLTAPFNGEIFMNCIVYVQLLLKIRKDSQNTLIGQTAAS